MSMPVPKESVEGKLEGLKTYARTAASGRTVHARFCGDCGTRLFHEPTRNPHIVNVKPGTLDDTSWLRPVGHLWLASAQPWFRPPEGELCYAGQPTDFEDLFRRFVEIFGDLASA